MINKKTKLTLIIGIAMMNLTIFATEAGSQQISRISFVGDGKFSDLRRLKRSLNAGKGSPGKLVEVARSTNAASPFAPGGLDPTFSSDGKLTTDFSSKELANAVAVQTDGKIVAAGTFFNATNYEFAVIRYNADGSLDTSFDGDGKVTTSVGGDSNSAFAVAIQTDGKIIAGGYIAINNSVAGFALVRYNADGSLDASFGAGGKVTTAFGYGIIYDIAIQTDGKIVAAGSSYTNTTPTFQDFTLARYNTDGSLDTSFDGDGKVTTDFDSLYDGASGVAIQADGKIVAAGSSHDDGELGFSSFALARYNSDGSLDASFDTDGKVITNFDGYGTANDVVIQTDGKIVTAGYSASCYILNCAAPDFTVVRYNTDGSLDTSFDGDGKVTSDFGGWDFAFAVALQTDGKIVAAGHAPDTDFALARYNSDGSPDTSFDTDGKVTTDFDGRLESASGVAVQAGGRIVAAGYGRNDLNYDFVLSRYNTDGSLDTSFDGDGKVTTSVFVASSAANAVATQLDGSIVIAGSSNNGSNSDFAVARYQNGYVDYGFAGDGKTTTDFGGGNDRANAVAVQTDGKIVAAGSSFTGETGYVFALARYNTNGYLDTTFDGDGKVTTRFGIGYANAVVIQPDGKIIAAGFAFNGGIASYFALVRYNTDGSLDNSFDGDGKVTTDFGGLNNAASAVAIQADGKIVAAGYSADDYDNTNSKFALVRYNPDGSLDQAFGTGGKVITALPDSAISEIAIQADGKIIAAGYSYNATTTDFTLARYNTDGSLDTSFDADGKVTTDFGGSIDEAFGVAIQRNGKIVAAGFSFDGMTNSNHNFALARFNPNGSLDDSFGSEGKVTTDFFGNSDFANAVAIQRDGKIVAAGSARNGTRTDFAAARYLGDSVTRFDFDGDGRADISVFRPSDRVWYLNQSTAGFSATQFGLSTDTITPADYDGDGKTDISVYRDGTWYWLKSSDNSFNAAQFGIASDTPVPADYTGDGRAELAVYRGGAWWSLNLANNQVQRIQFGLATDKPVAADYDGDGRVDQAVYRGNGEWHLNRSSQGYTVGHFGLATDIPVIGDYDGDGRTDLAVYRDGTWYLLQSTNGFTAFQFGLATDIPAPADYDGDGKIDAVIYRDGQWWLRQTTSGIAVQHFGLAGDRPIPSSFVP